MKIRKINVVYLILFTLLFVFSSCKLTRFAVYNTSNITDYKIFPNREISSSDEKFEFINRDSNIEFDSLTVTTNSDSKNKKKQIRQSFEDYLSANKTVAFLIIRNDSIIYENYFNDYNEASIVNSFSMAKSFLSALLGIAIEEGYIESTQQAITDYLPELKENGFDQITIDHLLDMRSGIKFSESYINPFGEVASFYYGTNLRKQISKLKLEITPGMVTNYRSVDTQLLGLLIERALKTRTLSQYLEEKIWQPLGMEYDATWSLDQKKNGLEKAYCCLNARARDFAKFGRLYLNKGNWNGVQIVPESWVEESTKIDTTKDDDWYYNNQWWIYENEVFAAEGHLGQFISVHPQSNMIFVRLGSNWGKTSAWTSVFKQLETKLGSKAEE